MGNYANKDGEAGAEDHAIIPNAIPPRVPQPHIAPISFDDQQRKASIIPVV